jgi:hypothetical protein
MLARQVSDGRCWSAEGCLRHDVTPSVSAGLGYIVYPRVARIAFQAVRFDLFPEKCCTSHTSESHRGSPSRRAFMEHYAWAICGHECGLSLTALRVYAH